MLDFALIIWRALEGLLGVGKYIIHCKYTPEYYTW